MNLNELYTDDDSIIVNKHGIGYGSFFYKVRTKKFLRNGQGGRLLFQTKKYSSQNEKK